MKNVQHIKRITAVFDCTFTYCKLNVIFDSLEQKFEIVNRGRFEEIHTYDNVEATIKNIFM